MDTISWTGKGSKWLSHETAGRSLPATVWALRLHRSSYQEEIWYDLGFKLHFNGVSHYQITSNIHINRGNNDIANYDYDVLNVDLRAYIYTKIIYDSDNDNSNNGISNLSRLQAQHVRSPQILLHMIIDIGKYICLSATINDRLPVWFRTSSIYSFFL